MRAFIKMKTKDKSFEQFVEFDGLNIQDGNIQLLNSKWTPTGPVANQMLQHGSNMKWALANVTEFKMIDNK